MLRTIIALSVLAAASTASAGITYVNSIAVPGGAQDLSGLGAGANESRLSFGSDLWFDRASGSFYGITDRGPGGGLISFVPRVNVFSLGIDGSTGAIGGFTQQRAVLFGAPGGGFQNGLNPRLLNGNSALLGNSFDSEGFVRLRNGTMLVSDEYGPSVKLFDADGKYLRSFETPANLMPKQADGTLNYVDGRGAIVSGRQDNRGFEGLAISKDNRTAWAVLQDPLVNEGASGDGRRSRNVRIVQYDVATGQATGQFIYQLEALADINTRVPSGNQFGPNAQGRNIGLSAIEYLGDGKFLVLERDNRGFGVEDPTGTLNTVGSKRIYLIDMNGATDVSGLSLAGTSDLPAGVTPVSKTLFLDVNSALLAAGATVAEKMEGIAIGPRLADNSYSLIIVTDNDFSVTQTGAGEQFDVCTSGVGRIASQVTLGAACPDGQFLIPSYAYAFRMDRDTALALGLAVPEPATWAMMIAGFGLIGGALRRRRATAA